VTFAALLLLAAAPACKRSVITKHEYMYVSAVETGLRDRVATLYTKVGTVHNGERVDVLERQRRFVRVRTDGGVEGWIEQRSLVTQEVFDGFQKLQQDAKGTSVQAHGTTRAELNMHLTPARDGERLYQLKETEKVEVLKRATTDKNAPKPPAPPKPVAQNTKSQPTTKDQVSTTPAPSNQPTATASVPAAAATPSAPGTKPAAAVAIAKDAEPAKPVMEDWYLVRNSAGQVGWVLMRMIDLDVPLDIAQYAEGRRIMGYFVLNTVPETIDGQPKEMPQYLVLLNEPKDGLAWDYNQIRVFTRNRNKHRYETAYRERNLEGYFPVTTGHVVFDKEGDLPTFTIRKKLEDGQMVDVTYKMNGPIVRRVPTAEELAAQKAKHDADAAARQQANAKPVSSKPKSKKKAKHKPH
jgi:hypothetical protein